MSLIQCKALTKVFGGRPVLNNVNLMIPEGRIVGLLGKNGAGKSTLIKLMNDLLVPTSGEVLFDGEPLGPKSKAQIAYLPERTYLDRDQKVSGALKFFSDFYENFDREKALRLLTSLDLDPGMKIGKMSKGMQEKLQLVLVMARSARLYILDEPLGGVDPATRDYILDTILSNFADGASVLISTHLIADIERILDDVVFIDNGQIVLVDEADAIRARDNASIDEVFRRMFRC